MSSCQRAPVVRVNMDTTAGHASSRSLLPAHMRGRAPGPLPCYTGTVATMAKLEYGRLTDAWKGEATDFTPLLAEQLDQVGAAIGVDLASLGKSEVQTTGGRRIDIVAQDADGSEFVIENQYGRADHDHLTRGLAYAVARKARGLVVVAEEHRDEFRAVAEYLNDLAEMDPNRGISVWLIEAKAVRIDGSPWAPLFTTVIEPNAFTANVEQAKQQASTTATPEAFWAGFQSDDLRSVVKRLVTWWRGANYRVRFEGSHVVLEAPGPSINGYRTVVAVYSDGRVMVPFTSYAGANSGIGIEPLMTDEFRARADQMFGFNGSEKMAKTTPGWLTEMSYQQLVAFCESIATAYSDAQSAAEGDPDSVD